MFDGLTGVDGLLYLYIGGAPRRPWRTGPGHGFSPHLGERLVLARTVRCPTGQGCREEELRKEPPAIAQPLLVGVALGLLVGVIAVDLIAPRGAIPGTLYVSLVMLSVASLTSLLPILAATAFMALIVYDLNSNFSTFQEIPLSVLAQTALLFIAIWVPVGAGNASRRVVEHQERMETPLHVCPSCKKVRDDEGLWKKLDEFLLDELSRESAVALCLDCRKRWAAGRR